MRWPVIGSLATALALAWAGPASAQAPAPAGGTAEAKSAERKLIGGLKTNAPETSDPEFLRVAGFFRVGCGFLNGQARRDAPGLDGTQVQFGADLDIQGHEPTGQVGLQFRPADDWRIFAAFASGNWDGKHVQGGTTPTITTPETIVFDGITFSAESIEAELAVFSGELGVLAVGHEFGIGRFEWGFGATYFNSELEITSVTTPGKRALETTEGGAPWLGARVVMTDLDWAHLEVAARAGFLWYGDNATNTFNTIIQFWAGIGAEFGPFLVTLRLEYLFWETHEYAHRQDEVFGLSVFTPTLGFTVRF